MNKIVRIIQVVLSLIVFISVFFISELIGQLAVIFFFLVLSLLNSNRKVIFTLFLRLSILVIFTLIVHLFFRFGENNYWAAFTTSDLWTKALFFTVRNTNILLIMSYLIKGGQKIDMSTIISYLDDKGPSKLVQPLTLAMRYVNLIKEEFGSLQQVHRIMGIKKPKHIIAQVKYYTTLIVPTIISSLERAEHLSIAMTSRGYNQE